MITAHRLRKLLSYQKSSGLFRWLVRPSNRVRVNDIAGSINNQNYRVIQVEGVKHKAARLAVLYVTGAMPADEVTFRNCDRADCRWKNLVI